VIELGLLADPKDAQRHHTHRKHDESGGHADEGTPGILLLLDGFDVWYTQVQHQQSHGNGKNSITQCRQSFNALS